MTTSQHLLSLADRVEGLSGPDREVDFSILCIVDPRAEKTGPLPGDPKFTASIDVARSLVPEGMTWRVGLYVSGRQYGAFVGDHINASAATPAAALCAASLRAIAGGASA